MRILYLTDLNYIGIPTQDFYLGDRPPMSWISALKPFHCNYNYINQLPDDEKFDITILSCLHENVDLFNINLEKIKKISKKTLFQHDSDHRYFYQKNSLQRSYMLNYIISNVDAILTHNDLDKKYYETLYKKPCFIHEQLIFDVYDESLLKDKQGIILGGVNDRYGALDGYTLIINSTNEKIYCFGEDENIPDITFIPNIWDYVEYNKKLLNFKYAFNLTPFAIGGSFPLQCAMLKVPCLGWDNSNPLKTCFPDLVVPYGDFNLLREKFINLLNDKDFYNYVSDYARNKFLTDFNIDQYRINTTNIFLSL